MDFRPIRTESDYQEALKRIEALFDAAPNTPEFDRLKAFSILLEAYEAIHYPIEMPDPIEAIYHYMDARGLSQRDLEQYIGSKSSVTEVLSRQRSLTLEMVRRLNQGLGIPAEVLIQPYEPLRTSA